jgi:glycosyltransferase involved in cell wall biosynthesis
VGIRVVVVDDNPHVTWQGRVYPVNATFHRFLSAVLDVPGGPVTSIVHAVPLRAATEAPRTLPLDGRLTVVGTEPFDGIAGFLRRALAITRRNAPILRTALADADLLWLKVPASNALLATWLARRARVPRFVYVAGSARDVVAAQRRGLVAGLAARAVAAAYDGVGRLVAVGGRRLVVGEGVVAGRGIVTSLVEAGEIRGASGPWPREPGRLRLAWAGRLAAGKGIETVLEAIAQLNTAVTLELLGDGPARSQVEARVKALGLLDRVTLIGYVAKRATYLDRLASADLFVFPSPAEGFPKVVLDAMAVGLPVLASPAGTLGELSRANLVETVPAGNAAMLREGIQRLAHDPRRASGLRQRGSAFAASHTAPAEAARLMQWWRAAFPRLA